MAKYQIAWLPGDGVGNEVMECTRMVLDRLSFDAEYVHGDIGWEFWKSEGEALPERTKEMMKGTECALFGAITSKPKEEAAKELAPELQDKGYIYFSPIVKLRQEFNLHTNLRPCKAYPGNPLNYKDEIDIVIFREKMKKFEQFGVENIALSTRIMTKQGCENIVNKAFQYAQKFGRKSVTVVDKPNVLRETGGLMIRTAREVAKKYPGIDLWETNIDAQCMWLVKNPEDYEVIVAENMFGDILSDLAAQLIGGLGFACSANIGDEYAVFEPTHGSAPKYFGQNKVNPTAMILTAKMMLDWLGETNMADNLERAVAEVIFERKVGTYDVGLDNTSLEVAEAVAEKL